MRINFTIFAIFHCHFTYGSYIVNLLQLNYPIFHHVVAVTYCSISDPSYSTKKLCHLKTNNLAYVGIDNYTANHSKDTDRNAMIIYYVNYCTEQIYRGILIDHF